jgi:hypothetical protein
MADHYPPLLDFYLIANGKKYPIREGNLTIFKISKFEIFDPDWYSQTNL